MMTRKHFDMIAHIVASIEDYDERIRTAFRFADELPRFNPDFDRQRFLQAALDD